MKEKDEVKVLNRYEYPDSATLLELKWKFQHFTTSEKIALLKEIKETAGGISEKIAELAGNDDDVVIRQWLVKNADSLSEGIEKQLLNDPDEYVRASAYENSNLGGGLLWPKVSDFNNLDKIARLAVMRRRHLPNDLIERIFDVSDKELDISSIEERAELITAYLTNVEEVSESRRDYFDHVDGMDAAFTRLYYQKLWDLISKWPEEFNWVKRLVYIYIGNSSNNKVIIFKDSPMQLKMAILEGCSGADSYDNEIINLAMQEGNDFLKRQAYAKANFGSVNKTELEKLLDGNDQAIIAGIAHNKNFPFSIRSKAAGRLRDLGDDLEAYWLGKELDQEEETGISLDEPLATEEASKKKSKIVGNIFGYGWTVLANLIALAVMLFVFSNTRTGFETKVIAILVIIYLTVRGFETTYGLSTSNLAIGLDSEFKRIRGLLKSPADKYEIEEFQETKEKAKKAMVKMYINSIFMSIAYIIALWNLFSSL